MSSHSEPQPSRPLSDEELIHVHEQVLVEKVDDRGTYKLMPLALLFIFSGLIFFGGTYLNLFSGHFSPKVFDERSISQDGAPAPVKIDMVALGKKQYELYCASCHQATGLGVPNIYPPLAKSEWVLGSEERMVRIVLHGLTGPITVAGSTFGAVPMPPTGPGGAGWSDDRIAAVVTYVRQAWGNQAGPVTTEKVTEIRTKEGTRKEWTAAELEKIP